MVGHAMGGPALLQIWCIEDGLPGLAIALCLQGGIVWDCKWQPGPQPSHSTRHASPAPCLHVAGGVRVLQTLLASAAVSFQSSRVLHAQARELWSLHGTLIQQLLMPAVLATL